MIILYLNNYQAALLASLTELQEALDRLKGAKAQFSGDCVAMDTIHYFVNQTRYYLFTAIDRYSRFAVAITCRRASSKNATAFVKLVHTVFPGNLSQVLIDNGSEFQGDFDASLQQQHIKHCYTYPRCPKMNAIDELSNMSWHRTLTFLSKSIGY